MNLLCMYPMRHQALLKQYEGDKHSDPHTYYLSLSLAHTHAHTRRVLPAFAVPRVLVMRVCLPFALCSLCFSGAREEERGTA